MKWRPSARSWCDGSSSHWLTPFMSLASLKSLSMRLTFKIFKRRVSPDAFPADAARRSLTAMRMCANGTDARRSMQAQDER